MFIAQLIEPTDMEGQLYIKFMLESLLFIFYIHSQYVRDLKQGLV